MPNKFESAYSKGEYYYIESRTHTEVQPRTHITWPLKDNKGRVVGFSWVISRQVTVLEEGPHKAGNNGLHAVGDPLDVFIARGCQTRNGFRYGSGDIIVEGTDLEKVRAEFLKRVQRARDAATKRWAPKV